ncbi:tyrosyl-DNA phosphodiesterase-domain-containing protein [Podospora didyma]|uniref:Tyrosyl-DNA phosphodiesterase-domain-containing protein n=1 Tax=Podospora didyma TaxID=330526 RepID=A0AAE0KFV1_9PEZI|nr:tyrosyl-DNA phosphodiesterase-domain-containing protein [Podospora didyma]
MAENWAAEMNGSDLDDDEALRMAIAMSLGQGPQDPAANNSNNNNNNNNNNHNKTEAIDLTNDDGDKPPVLLTPPLTLGLLGHDRKKMEEERLARLNKRKADSSLEATSGGGTNESRPLQRRKITTTSPSTSGYRGAEGQKLEGHKDTGHASALPFPRGVVKKTWVNGQPRLGDDIKIEEVLQKSQLRLAVLSSFQWDDEWMMAKINFTRTKVILVAFAENEAHQAEMIASVPRANKDNVRFCFPPMKGMGYMHSKLQLLKYDGYFRIVVPTANLVPYDWGETGTMENMVFIIDLPKLESTELQDAQKLTPFGEDLCYFLDAQGLDAAIVNSLRKYDFSETRRYGFVHTIAGSHSSGDAWRRTGYCGLGRAVNALGLGSKRPVEMDYVCASLGALNDTLLKGLYNACQGDSGRKEYESRAARNGKGGADKNLRSHVRVFFPSHETVVQSRGGRNGAGTICFQDRWWKAPSFPHDVLRDCRSKRKGLLMHSKIIFVRRQAEDSESPSLEAATTPSFAYVGSANLSESAWGRLVKDRGTAQPKLTCRNWEAGVIVQTEGGDPPSSSSSSINGGDSKNRSDGLGVFEGSVPVPMEVPGTPMPLDGHLVPWFFQSN